ncbi:hypothetical protein ACP70R_022215 [Stipagrostis hirtigluma subsp. patula]
MTNQQGRADDSIAVTIASLVEEFSVQLDNDATAFSAAGRTGSGPIIIAEVGKLTRNVSPGTYDPHHVSISPYHMINSPDLARDDEKKRSLAAVLSAATSAGATPQVYLEAVASLEDQARRCYAHSFGHVIKQKAFLRMLLLDGCYLLHRLGVLRRGNVVAATANGTPPISAAGDGGDSFLETAAVLRDVLYLAENQIPFFVLDKIHQLTFPNHGVSAAETIAGYVGELLKRQQYSTVTLPAPAPAPAPEPGNLLHLLHMHLRPSELGEASAGGADTGRRVRRWRTATEYHFVGVEMKKRPLTEGGARCILDVKLNGGGALEIPPLVIDAETWRLLRNLMALEQRNPAIGRHVTSYCVFLSQLASTEADVDRLSRKGIIEHGLGNNAQVAGCFADLCKGVVYDPGRSYLRATCQKLEMRFQSRLRRWMAWLGHKYFGNPWLAVGLVAAAVGLTCTVVQAVYSVLSYRPGAN